MSVENLRLGLNDLTSEVQSARKEKEAKAAVAKKQQAAASFGQQILNSPEGSTPQGKMIGQGLQLGQISGEEATKGMGEIMNDRHKSFFLLQQAAGTETDPVKKQQLQHIVNTMAPIYDKINYSDAYWKAKGDADGMLTSKKAFGVLKKGKGGGGGGDEEDGVDGTALPPDMTNLSIKLKDYGQDLTYFLKNDPIAAPLIARQKNFQAGALKQDITFDEYKKLQARTEDFFEQRFRQDPYLGKPGMEAARRGYVAEAVQNYNINGMKAFSDTGKSKGNIITNQAMITRAVPKSIVFAKTPEEGVKNMVGRDAADITAKIMKAMPTIPKSTVSTPKPPTPPKIADDDLLK